MIRLHPVIRLILAAVTLLLSAQSYAGAMPAKGRAGVIHNGSEKIFHGSDRPEEHAVLTASFGNGNVATRNLPGGGSGGSGVPVTITTALGHVPDLQVIGTTSSLRGYRLQNAHIVLAQFQALFPKHWFW